MHPPHWLCTLHIPVSSDRPDQTSSSHAAVWNDLRTPRIRVLPARQLRVGTTSGRMVWKHSATWQRQFIRVSVGIKNSALMSTTENIIVSSVLIYWFPSAQFSGRKTAVQHTEYVYGVIHIRTQACAEAQISLTVLATKATSFKAITIHGIPVIHMVRLKMNEDWSPAV